MRHLARLTQQRSQDRADRERSIGIETDECGVRKMPLRRVGDYPKGSKGQIMGSGESRRDMRFHVRGDGAGSDMEGAFLGRVRDRHIHAGDIDDGRAAQSLGQPLRPGPVAFEIAAVFGDDCARDERRPGAQPWSEAAGNAEAQDRRDVRSGRAVELGLQLIAIAAAGDDGDAGPGGDPRFGDEACDGKNRPLLAYMPTRTFG